MGADELDEVIAEFLVESHENLDRLDRELVTLERHHDADTLASIFRTIHTIKGTAGFLGFGELERVTHAGESLLARLRDGELSVTARITSGLLATVDAVRHLLAEIERDGAEGGETFDELVAGLVQLGKGEQPAPDEAGAPPAAAPAPGAPVVAEPPAAAAATSIADSSIRVDVTLLDELMNLVGELVLARNQILQFTDDGADPALAGTSQRLDLITTDLQEGVMKTRMQVIDTLWSKFPRVVRDLAVACGKDAALRMDGRDTELDKTILEAIKDPLTHLVRNAVDHGLEPPEERVAAGKPRTGTVELRAFHEGGQVIIEIGDDGRGLDPAALRAKALERELITPDEAAAMASRDLVDLIFLPGFSTATTVSNVSGRGVGMDVVKTNIEAIGGTIDVQSTRGEGTTFKIKIPLTLAIIPALLVAAGGGRYAIPQVSLLELLRLDPDDPTSVEVVHGAPVHRLRGRLLPLVFLDEVLGLPGDPSGEGSGPRGGGRAGAPGEPLDVVVLQADGEPFGLVVSRIEDTAEIVVKPLGRLIRGVPTFAGATIMGDGRVALILDVLGIADHVGLRRAARDLRAADDGAGDEEEGATQTVLLVSLADRSAALLLEMVARLEEIDPAGVERAGDLQVVQYRGDILPLVFLAEELGASSSRSPGDPLRVVVYREGDTAVGLVVDGIHDIVEEALDIRRHTARPGTLGSAVVQGRVTDVLDVGDLLRRRLPGLFAGAAA